MPLLSQRVLRGLLPSADASRAPAVQRHPVCIVLDVRAGCTPSPKPPVRIFLGSERAQFRAERVFLWSVEKHRDPTRRYEIHLLRDLAAFSRRFWLTGFTNYRFAIPHYCDYTGRAIYNDTDQIYLRDPAELFDTPMERSGFLSINDRDTSVMLIDCKRMAGVWSESAVASGTRQSLEADARAAGWWGHLDGGWNSRDKEYDPGHSAVVHYTTLHTQPWRPFPEQLVYFDNPVGNLWLALEKEADDAGFLPINAQAPSPEWSTALATIRAVRPGPMVLEALEAGRSPPGGVLQVGSGVLERVPDADLPWVLDRLFSLASEVFIALDEPLLSRPGHVRRLRSFWLAQIAQAARRYPSTAWRLERQTLWGAATLMGGPAAAGPVLVLTQAKPGHNQQARAVGAALAQASQRALQEIHLPLRDWQGLMRRTPPAEVPMDTAVVVASGWLPTRIARSLQARRPGLRLVLLGRKAGPVPESGAMVLRCAHYGLPPHPAALETRLPLNSGDVPACRDVTPWQSWLDAPRRVALLVGGASRSHRLDMASAMALAGAAQGFCDRHDAALLVVSSRRTQPVLPALQQALEGSSQLYRWHADDPTNPYGLALAHADALIVTGESESMLADALAAGQVPLIWPLPARTPTPWQWIAAAVARRAGRPTYNRRGSVRPQQGLEYLCARALERAWVLPPRELEQLHALLVKEGRAAMFDEALALPARAAPLSELNEAARTVIEYLQLDCAS